MKDDNRERYVHSFLGECVIEKVTPKGFRIKTISDGEVYDEAKEDIVSAKKYISEGDLVRDSLGLKTGVVIRVRDYGIERYWVEFEGSSKFCSIDTHDKKSIRVVKKKEPVFSIGETVVLDGDKILIVKGINETAQYRNYSVEMSGYDDIVSEHYAIFLKAAKRKRKTDSFSLDGELL